jgi:hypothetical protein
MPEESNTSTNNLPMQGGALTQELVEKLADKVMALLLEDLKNESERYRLPSRKLGGRDGISGAAGGW